MIAIDLLYWASPNREITVLTSCLRQISTSDHFTHPITIRHIQSVWAIGILSQGHMGAPLYHYTGQVGPIFWNSRRLVEWKWYHNVTIEAQYPPQNSSYIHVRHTDNGKHQKNRCWHVPFMLSEQVLTRWWHPAASCEAPDLLHWQCVRYRTATLRWPSKRPAK